MIVRAFDGGELVRVLYGPQGGQVAEVLEVKPNDEWGFLYKLGFSPGSFVAPGNEWQPECMLKRP